MSLLLNIVLIYLLGINKEEKKLVLSLIKNKLINYKFNHSMTFNMNSLGYYIKRKNIEGDTVRENTSFKLKQSLLSPNSDLFSNTEGKTK